jgi:hypothetical protein
MRQGDMYEFFLDAQGEDCSFRFTGLVISSSRRHIEGGSTYVDVVVLRDDGQIWDSWLDPEVDSWRLLHAAG